MAVFRLCRERDTRALVPQHIDLQTTGDWLGIPLHGIASQLRDTSLEIPQQVAKIANIPDRSVAGAGGNCKSRHGGGSRIARAAPEFPLVSTTETRCIREAEIVSNRRNLDGGRGVAQHGVCVEQSLFLNIVSHSAGGLQ